MHSRLIKVNFFSPLLQELYPDLYTHFRAVVSGCGHNTALHVCSFCTLVDFHCYTLRQAISTYMYFHLATDLFSHCSLVLRMLHLVQLSVLILAPPTTGFSDVHVCIAMVPDHVLVSALS